MKSKPSSSQKHTIAVFGSSRVEVDSREYKQAYELGFLLAKTGFTIINGGGPGSMEATALGAREGGGIVIGAIVRGEDWSRPNSYNATLIECEDVFLRIREIFERSMVFVVLKGGTGTFAEFAIVWNLLSLEPSHERLLILLGNGWQEIMAIIRKHMIITKDEEAVLRIASDPTAVLRTINRTVSLNE